MVTSKDRPRPEVAVQQALGVSTASRPSADHMEVLDRQAVERLLLKTPELADLVREAADQLVNFIPDARLRLELLTDSDYGGDEQIFMEVATSMREDEALAALRRFDSEWWVHHIGRARGLLCIDISDG